MASRRWFANLIGSGVMARNVAALLTGTVLAQAVTFGVMILLARLYTPADFGWFAIAQSIVSIGTTIASLRYDIAIMLPASDVDARVVQRLAARSIGVVSIILGLTLLLLFPWLKQRVGDEQIAAWFIATALLVFLTAQVANRQYWLTRRGRFNTVAANRVIAAVAVAVSQIVSALVLGGFRGLVVGATVGQLIALINVSRHVRELNGPLPPGAPSIWGMARRYKKMPLINGPNALVDAVSSAGMNILIARVAVAGLGQYSLAQKSTTAPASMINSALVQVFLHRMSKAPRGTLTKLVTRALSRISVVTVPVFLLMYFVLPAVVPWVFGNQWVEAGQLAQALVPWVGLGTLTAPTSNVFVVTERQGTLLAFSIVYGAVPLLVLGLSALPLIDTVRLLSWSMSALLLVSVALALGVSRRYDRRSSVA